MRQILQVVRVKNLLVVIATMYAMRFFIIAPLLQIKGMQLQLGEVPFSLLVLATVFITAAGYVINDYFDTRADLINHPETVIVGRKISRRTAIILHLGLSLVGVGAGTLVSFLIQKPTYSLMFFLVAGMLWFYSTTYKRQFLLGNIIVSILSALVPLLVLIFELPPLSTAYWAYLVKFQLSISDIVYWIAGYALFAFMLTFVREVVKDIEDFEGDQVFGRNTIPIVLGIQPAKIVAVTTILAAIMVLIYLFGAYLNRLPMGGLDYYTFVYLFLFIVVPLFIVLLKVYTATQKSHYRLSSALLKAVMLAGLGYSVVFKCFVI
ncbi:MAG: geranylgeranylglycerol-phosphate geranylgeranyltransferase [Bacteroidales bacterium]|nr:geranylgeranylglycerol-phosphate geranylgeranyltransferase [Bacteroidales bacterium]MBN2749031.1 geranylgeranylglycerol-phosphate geranylgeranyltransferase [Bacteroidales bacterium]